MTGIIVLCLFLISQNTVFAAAKPLKLNYDNKTVNYTGVTYKILIDNKEVKTDLPGITLDKKNSMIPLRAVFEALGGTVVWNSKTQIMDITYRDFKLQFQNNSSVGKVNGKSVKMTTAAKKINDRLVIPVSFIQNIKGLSALTDTKTNVIKISTEYVGSVKDITTKTSGTKTIVTLSMNNHKGYQYYRLTNPNRIVVEFSNVKAVPNEITAESDRISGISVSAISTTTASIVINLKEMSNFSVTNTADGCQITIDEHLNASLSYENTFDRVYFSLKNIILADVQTIDDNSIIVNRYDHKYDKDNFTYTITIPSSSAISLKDEVLEISDTGVDTLEIFREPETLDTKIIIKAKKDFTYFVSYNDKRKQSEIVLLTPAKEDEVLVVIDAGHGGEDSGAVNGKIYEKDLNLKIALKLEKLLKENNIKTFMIRQDDTFVALYDRPYMANALNAALFVSIHHNSATTSKAYGTETLYYAGVNNGDIFSGFNLAKTIQSSLMSRLGTYDRGAKFQKLAVTKYTTMPAALAEIGFMSNSGDLKLMVDDGFQQKAAEGLCEAIVNAVETVKSLKTTMPENGNENENENEET